MNPFRALYERWKAVWLPIPEDFFSFENEGPFQVCSVCSEDLSGSRWGYLIQKTFVNDRLAFECAICTGCCKNFQDEMSRPSKRAVRKHVKKSRRIKHDLERCHFCVQPLPELTAHSRIIDCMDGEMLVWEYPLVLCGDCEIGIYECLSQTTRDEHDRWMDEHFGVPPGLEIKVPGGGTRKPMLI